MARIGGEVKVVYSAEDRATAVGKNVQGGLRQTGNISSRVSDNMKKQWLSASNVMKVALVAVAALAVRAFKNMAVETMRAASEIDKFTRQTGMAAEEVQKLKYAGEQMHLEFETLSKTIPVLSKYMSYAQQGMVTYKREFDKMNISVSNADGSLKSTYDVLLEMSDFMSKSGANNTEKMAIATALLGRRGAELLPFLKMGREEIEKLGKEFEKTGAMLSGDEVLGMKVIGDNITAIKNSLAGFGRRIIAEMSPMLNALTNWLKDNAPALADIGASIGRGLSDLISWALTSFFPFFIRAWNLSKLAVEGVLWSILKLREAQMKLQEFTTLGAVKLLPWWEKEREFIEFNIEQLQKQMNATLDADEKLSEMQRSLKTYFSNAGKMLQEQINKLKELDNLMPPDEENIQGQENWLKLLEREQKTYEKILALNKELKGIQKQFYADTWAMMMESANLAGDDLGKFSGMALSGMKGMWDASLGYDPYAEQMQQLTDFYQKRIDVIGEQFQIIQEQMIANNQTELEMEKAKQFELYQIKQEYLQRDLQMTGLQQAQKLQMYQNNINMTMGILGMLASFSDENSKAIFAIEKAAAVASILVNAHKSAALAMATIPPPAGEILAKRYLMMGYAMAAATAAMAIKQMSQQTAGVNSGGSVAGGGGYSYSQPETSTWQEEEKRTSRTINVYVYGNIVDHDKFARELIPSLDKAWADGAS